MKYNVSNKMVSETELMNVCGGFDWDKVAKTLKRGIDGVKEYGDEIWNSIF